MSLSAFAAVCCAFLAASVTCWAVLIRRLASGRAVLPQEPAPAVPWGFADLLITLVFLAWGESWAVAHVRARFGLTPDSLPAHWDAEAQVVLWAANSLAAIATLALSVCWLVARYRPHWRELGLGTGPDPSANTRVGPRGSVWSATTEPSGGPIPPHGGQSTWGRDVARGAFAFLAVAPLVFGIQWLLSQFFPAHHPLLDLLKKNPAPRFFVMSLFAAVLVAPVVEEYLFRLLLQSWIERFVAPGLSPLRVVIGGRDPLPVVGNRAVREAGVARAEPGWDEPPGSAPSRWIPIVISSTLFALMHLSQGPAPIPLFVFALVLGYLFARTRRILPCIVTHALLNCVSLTGLWLAVRCGWA